jgi:hypothetical protein
MESLRPVKRGRPSNRLPGLVKANLIKNPSYLINELIFSSTHGCGVVINYTNNGNQGLLFRCKYPNDQLGDIELNLTEDLLLQEIEFYKTHVNRLSVESPDASKAKRQKKMHISNV